MKKRRNAARRFVQNGVKKYIFNRQKEGENYFLNEGEIIGRLIF